MRQGILPWLESVGTAVELEAMEAALISSPLGTQDEKTVRDSLWQSEGLVVLAWALGPAELPAYYAPCEPSDIANPIGFLGSRETTALHEPRLRDSAEIEKWADHLSHAILTFATVLFAAWMDGFRSVRVVLRVGIATTGPS